MKPLILPIILIIAGGAGIYLSIDLQGELEATIAERQDIQTENTARTRVLRDTEEKRGAADGEVATWTTTRGEKNALVTSETDKNNELNTELKSLNDSFESKNSRIKKLQEDLAQYDFKDPQEIVGRQTQANDKNKELLAAIDEMTTLADATGKKNTQLEGQLETLQQRQQAYRQRMSANSREYSIVAVDPAWNFVVINAGEGSSISPQTPLMVSRGGKTIAKLKISSLEKSQTIADIIEGSLSPGNRIEVGDRVIIVKPQD